MQTPTRSWDATMDRGPQHCLTAVRLDTLAGGPRPWAPGTREEDVDIERAAANPDGRVWCMSEVDIFCDLDDREMDAMGAAAPMRNYGVGDLVYTPVSYTHLRAHETDSYLVCR